MHITKEFTTESCGHGELIAESFGVTGGFVNRIADLDIPDNWQVLYITGESGCGKSTIMGEIAHRLEVEIHHIDEGLKDKQLISLWGDSDESQAKAIERLTRVGLSDAVLWLNTYRQLSDSQKARMEIAVQMVDGNIVIVDEFLSTLDRETAKAVAYSIQKAIRQQGKRLVAVTAHDDLEDYLQPDCTLRGTAFPSRWELTENHELMPANPVLDAITLRYGSKEDYRSARLGELHYKGKYTGGTKEYLFAYRGERMVALLVSIYNMHTGGRRISRLVVHPSYRGCGIGKMLVKFYIHDYPDTDVVAAMGLYNPVFSRAGMVRTKDVNIKPPTGLKKSLSSFGFDETRWHDKKYLSQFVSNNDVRNALASYSKKATSLVCPAGHYLRDSEIKRKIKDEPYTAARVLFGLRPRVMAKYEVAAGE